MSAIRSQQDLINEHTATGLPMIVGTHSWEECLLLGEFVMWERDDRILYKGWVAPLWEKDGLEYYKGICKECGQPVRCVFYPDPANPERDRLSLCEINKPQDKGERMHKCVGDRTQKAPA